MYTKEQFDNWFSYHGPDAETAPHYAAVRAAEAEAHGLTLKLAMSTTIFTPALCEEVSAATRAFAEVVDREAPDCADKAAAIRCIRLARNAMNEVIMVHAPDSGDHFLFQGLQRAREQLQQARWQANSAIACRGK